MHICLHPDDSSLNIPSSTYTVRNILLRATLVWWAFFGSSVLLYAAQITGLEAPNSFVGDQQGKEFFISNVNGEPDARDNNGFITKVDAEGKVLNSSSSKAASSMSCCMPPKAWRSSIRPSM